MFINIEMADIYCCTGIYKWEGRKLPRAYLSGSVPCENCNDQHTNVYIGESSTLSMKERKEGGTNELINHSFTVLVEDYQ